MRSSVPNVKVNHRTLSKQPNDSERRRGNGSRIKKSKENKKKIEDETI